MPVSEATARLTLALALCAGDGRKARAAVEEILAAADALIHDTGARVLEPQLEEARAELARVVGDAAERERHLREAHRLYGAVGATGHARRLAGELGLG
jgi:hypothetical protein